MRVVHLAPVAALLLASVSELSGQAFEGVIGMRVAKSPGEMQLFLKGGKLRMEITTPGGAGVMIVDPAAGEQYMVMPAQQMYMVIKMADVTPKAESPAEPKADASVTMTATGRKDHVAGFECEIYRFRDERSVTDVCLASGLGSLGGAGAVFGGGMGGMGGMGRGRGPGASGGAPAWAHELARKGAFFPLRVSDSTGAMQYEVTKVERQSLDAALFAPPAGYQRMDLPGMGRRPPPPQGR